MENECPTESAGSNETLLLPARMVNEFACCPRLAYFEWVDGVFADNADIVGDGLGKRPSEQILEAFQGDVGGVENLFQGSGLDDVMPGNNHDVLLVGHRNMFAFAKDVETSPLKGSHDTIMRDLRELGHVLTSTVLSFFSRFRSSMLSR